MNNDRVIVEGIRTFEDVRIEFRNFAGKEGDYNKEGDRNFCIILPTDKGIEMRDEGWNIKFLKPRDEDEEPAAYIHVAVAFGHKPPIIKLVTSTRKTRLREQDIDQLDWAEIIKVQVAIRPYNWDKKDKNGRIIKSGVKAYVKTLYVTVAEDEFESGYYDIPESGYEEPSSTELPF